MKFQKSTLKMKRYVKDEMVIVNEAISHHELGTCLLEFIIFFFFSDTMNQITKMKTSLYASVLVIYLSMFLNNVLLTTVGKYLRIRLEFQ